MKKTIMQFLMAITLGVAIFAMTGVDAQAAATPKLEEEKVSEYFSADELKNRTADYLISLDNIKKGAKVTVKSSNPKVAKVKYFDSSKSVGAWFDDDYKPINYGVEVDVRKEGTTTITCTVKQGGKTYNLSCVFTVKKYKNPVSAFKIGSLNCASEFNNSYYSEGTKFDKLIQGFIDKSTEKTTTEYGITLEEIDETKLNQLMSKKVAIKITPKKGFKVKGIWLSVDPIISDGDATKSKKIKNGAKYSYNTILRYDSIYVELVDKDGTVIGLDMLMPDTPKERY